ncbi:AraC family transcriptional regulator ligand-binding domain-containing protein [Oleiharenicola lentus]|uniref:AraC family transcriptional regulator n=1 Tax=Oleiharenicola lentus TaxID=2508720 RepID=UPI003F66CDAB
MKVPSTFWLRVKAMGLKPAVLLRHSGLPATVYNGQSVITTAELFALWRSILELGKDSTLGWKGIRDVGSDKYHPSLIAALNAPNYRDCLERLARYKQLCGAQEFRFTELDDEFTVEISWPFAAKEEPPALLLDAMLALIVELGRRGTKTALAPKRVELTRQKELQDGLGHYFGCPIKYRSRRNALVLRASDIELPFVAHNEELLQMLAPQFEEQWAVGRKKQGAAGKVKWVLKRLLSGSPPDVAAVAKELGMSERTLQRRITEEGRTFRELLNETRKELIREYLSDDSITVSEAAFLIGFENTNSFYRAFRSWEGKTPAEWRAEARGKK